MFNIGFFYSLGKAAADSKKKTRCTSAGRCFKGDKIKNALDVAGSTSQPSKGVFKWRSGSKQ